MKIRKLSYSITCYCSEGKPGNTNGKMCKEKPSGQLGFEDLNQKPALVAERMEQIEEKTLRWIEVGERIVVLQRNPHL